MAERAGNQQRALLLVEDNVDDAFLFSRALRVAQPERELYTVPGLESAQRYLNAAVTDGDCMPAAIFVSLDLAEGATPRLVDWIRGKEHLRDCPVFVLGGSAGVAVGGVRDVVRKPIDAEGLGRALAQLPARELAPA